MRPASPEAASIRTIASPFIALVPGPSAAVAMNHGHFSGDPKTVWLTEDGQDRSMKLLERFVFTDPDGKDWFAPLDAIINGASIPRALWTIAGSPYTGDYRRASIVHDVACANAGRDAAARRKADRMIYHACIAGGCSVEQATVIYLGVRIGAAASTTPQWTAALAVSETGPRVGTTATENKMEYDFRRAAEMVLSGGGVDDIDAIESRTDRALADVTNTKPRSLKQGKSHSVRGRSNGKKQRR
jgi:hypothetical protein